MVNVMLAVVIVASSLWVYNDARSIGVKKGQNPDLYLFDLDPAGWLSASLALWMFALPVYLYSRRMLKQRATLPMTEAERDSSTRRPMKVRVLGLLLALGSIVAFLVVAGHRVINGGTAMPNGIDIVWLLPCLIVGGILFDPPKGSSR